MIKAIVFDITNVITENTPYMDLFAQRLSILLDKNIVEIRNVLRDRQKEQYNYRKIDLNEFLENIIQTFKMELSSNELATILYECCYAKEDMVDLLISLHKNYQIGYLTNRSRITPEIVEYVKKNNLFDFGVCSYDTGYKKPNDAMYTTLLQIIHQKKLAPNEILFIDDLLENLLPAQKLGMQAHQFKGHSELKDFLKIQQIIL